MEAEGLGVMVPLARALEEPLLGDLDLLSFFTLELFEGSSDGFAFGGEARRGAFLDGDPTPPGGGPMFVLAPSGGLFSPSASGCRRAS